MDGHSDFASHERPACLRRCLLERTQRDQPVHQRIRFLVERGIRTRIPPSARNFPAARAVPGATIYANLQTCYFIMLDLAFPFV